MSRQKERIAHLMEEARQAHRERQQVWAEVRAATLGNAPAFSPEFYRANTCAYEVARPSAERRDRALRQLFGEELPPNEPFLRGDPEAVDTVLDFPEIDIPAFRCGYAKAWYLTRLKRIPLRERHQARLRQLTLALCRSATLRRELKYLGRLLIWIADLQFVEQLQALGNNQAPLTVFKARRTLYQIRNGRKDLQCGAEQPPRGAEA